MGFVIYAERANCCNEIKFDAAWLMRLEIGALRCDVMEK